MTVSLKLLLSRTRFKPDMWSFKVLLCALALTLLGVTVESSSGGGGTPNHNYDLSGSALTRLYNSPVYKAERMKRPLDGTSFVLGPISHSGVRVTLADGAKWLIHKGGNYGVSSQTVVTDARHMSSDWRVVQTAEFNGRKTVADFVATGGSEYSLLFDNCHMGSNRMMDQ
ncbi:uncharacterized protein LOC127362983 [Xyrichtys novacula]|uniref:Uncharacterized protein LOC127362983 n=1 Tax=Xyrichtys novacula TaxID=13765 RepID=A0AAV1FKB1_XYRNO|nr:uncharacterized protein LOC127362983 [Xyrichtys novacula]